MENPFSFATGAPHWSRWLLKQHSALFLRAPFKPAHQHRIAGEHTVLCYRAAHSWPPLHSTGWMDDLLWDFLHELHVCVCVFFKYIVCVCVRAVVKAKICIIAPTICCSHKPYAYRLLVIRSIVVDRNKVALLCICLLLSPCAVQSKWRPPLSRSLRLWLLRRGTHLWRELRVQKPEY